MAASAEENDYVHLLMKKWRERNVDFFLAVKQAAAWEVKANEGRAEEENFDDLACFKPDFIIFRLAENVSTEIDGVYFSGALDDLIKKLNKGNGEVIYSSETVGYVMKDMVSNGSWTSWCTYEGIDYPQEVTDAIESLNEDSSSEN